MRKRVGAEATFHGRGERKRRTALAEADRVQWAG